MRIPVALYEGFYMSVLQPADHLGPASSRVAKAKAARPMERRGRGPLSILYRDPWARARLPRPVCAPCDRVDVPEVPLALAVHMRQVWQAPEFSRCRLLPANEESVLHRLCAGTSGGSHTILGLGVLLPDALPLAVRVARRPRPARIRTPTSLATRLFMEADEARDEP